MSHIAAALAKSKGKAVTPPPETTVDATGPGLGVSTPPIVTAESAPPIVPPKRSPALIAGLAALAILCGGAAWWLVRRAPAEAPIVAPAPAPKASPEITAQIAAKNNTQAALVRTLSNPTPVAEPPPPAATPAASSVEYFEIVRKLAVSAVMVGSNGRAVINGKTRQVGAEVAPGLTLVEIAPGRLLFRDQAGNDYPRRF
ncbi:MAG: hypothetical protein HZA32_17775 [Opitutae bacterium]|nr:hypothetical protein [Opitutae bacterium]